jgi:23S rRNA (cytosine1962-C5)-methyltransferase
LFCYNGGFGIAAAVAGASKVVCVDSSAKAIDATKKNADLNGVSVSAVCSDVTEFLRACKETFDVVVCDPPKVVEFLLFLKIFYPFSSLLRLQKICQLQFVDVTFL